MSRESIEVFHALMKKGWIDRSEDQKIWSYTRDLDIQNELDDIKAVMGVDIIPVNDRIYLVPTQDNTLFLKNNIDFRKDVKNNDTRIVNIYLMNYLSIYLIYIFFSGEGRDPLCREFILKDDFINLFTDHCKVVEKSSIENDDKERDYSANFRQLASLWLSKTNGEKDSKIYDEKYGVLNRVIDKYKIDGIFEVSSDDKIRPTRKTKNLMPYFLRKERITAIQNWIKEGESNATD